MISRFSITDGGGGANSVINDASGDTGIMGLLKSPIGIATAALAGLFVFMGN